VISRRAGLTGLLGLALILGMIWAVFYLANLDPCMTGSSGGSCPTLADVNGVRYGVAAAHELVDIASDLTPFAPIARTNVPGYFSDMNTFQIRGIDPTAVLVAPAKPALDEDVGPYRLLYGPNSDRAFPALCDYIPIELRLDDDRCGAPA
jgi:hypothetical protein